MKFACGALLAGIFAFTPLARAQAPDTVFLEQLTWTEVRDQVRSGKTTVLVPIGGTEQSGPHMALGKHNVRAKLLAEKIARRLGNAIVAPVVAYVPEGRIEPPTEHMRFPGTISVPQDAFEKVLESTARSFRRHGFTDIVFLGDHGGYRASLRRVAERLDREWAKSGARVHPLPEYYEAVDKAYPALLASRGHSAAEIGTHAGLADTSLTLALDPSLVRSQGLPDGRQPENGVRGDPRKASRELGELGVELIVSTSVEAIKESMRR